MSVSHVQTKREIQQTLAQLGMHPERRLGQNFLVDGNLMRSIVDAAEVNATDTVLEVGGGTGGLSDLLAAAAGRLIIVEIHRLLSVWLQERFADVDHVTVFARDALEGKHTIAPEVLEAVKQSQQTDDGRFLLVSNLPYNAGTPLIMNLVTAWPRVARMCFTIQKEVADRIAARAATKDYGPLSIAVQTAFAVNVVRKLPASAFWPPPKIESSLVRLDRTEHPFADDEQLARFLALVRAAFAHRRKTLRYNLGRYLPEDLLNHTGEILDLSARAEAIPLEQWHAVGLSLGADLPPVSPMNV